MLTETDLVPGVAGVGTLVGLALPLGVPIALAGALAAGVYLGVRWVLPQTSELEVAPGVTRAQLDAALAHLWERAAELRRLAAGIPRADIQQRVMGVAATANLIVAELREDPKDLAEARGLADTYLDAAADILRTYVRLSTRPVASAREALARVEQEGLPQIERALTDLYEKLHTDEITNLEVASEMLDFRSRHLS